MKKDSTIVQEFIGELRDFTRAGAGINDSIIPPLVFAFTRIAATTEIAILTSLLYAAVLIWRRIRTGEQLGYALAGVGGIFIALAAVVLAGSARYYYVPGMLGYAGIALACIVTPFTSMPFVAWTSFMYRRWPKQWYQHKQVRPVYVETTWLWALFFITRLSIQLYTFTTQGFGAIALVDFLTGWPSTVVLLLVTFVYGRWRLINLGGPSVDEFCNNTPPPWESQRYGF